MAPEWAPDGVDIETPSVARIYDFLLGGSHNFEADRALARQAVEAIPDLPLQAATNRAFMHRAVRYLVGEGVTQFLDLGSGIPTLANVHEIAQAADQRAKVVYVDIDEVAVAHSRYLLDDNPNAVAVLADLRRPEAVLANPEVTATLDLSQPVAVLLVAVMHAVSNADDPAGIMGTLRERLAPGSFLVMAHGVNTRVEDADLVEDMSRRTTTPMTLRTPTEVAALFDGFDLVDPGLVWAPLWRPESADSVPDRPERSANLVGVGRLR
jgi:S-adenosyl methyltransferase